MLASTTLSGDLFTIRFIFLFIVYCFIIYPFYLFYLVVPFSFFGLIY